MKILHIVTSLAMGGVESMLFQLLSRLDTQANEHAVISLREDDVIGAKIRGLGIPVYSVGMMAGKPTYSSIMLFRKYLTTVGRPDIIHGWDYYGDYAASFSKTMMGWIHTPVIWSIHHTPFALSRERKLTALLIKMGAYFSRGASRIVYVSWASQARHESMGYRSQRARVIPNGFDPSEFKPSADESALFRSELGIDPDVRLIGSIARYHPMKDHVNFLNAAGRLLQRRDDVHFLLAGRQVDENNPVLMEIVRENGLDKKVHLLGERPDVCRLMNALDIFTVSSAWGESFPLVIGEAMLCGVPCAVTDIGDCARMVGDTGTVVTPRDAEALCRAWEKTLEMSEQERLKIGMAARQRVMELFSLQNIVRQYEKLYSDTLNTGDAT